MNDATWRPTATRETLELRASLLARVRRFFGERKVLEVETPVVVNVPVTDMHIESARVFFGTGDIQPPDVSQPYFLHTSPEYAMKRLLAAGSGDIFQICHVVRGMERGRHHNAEFTLIEWYRIGFSLDDLMSEVEALLRVLLGDVATCFPSDRLSYRDVFLRELQIDPFTAPIAELTEIAKTVGYDATLQASTAGGPAAAPNVHAPAPSAQTSAASRQGSVASAQLPAPSGQAPATSAQLPAPSAQAPATNAQLPAPSAQAPAAIATPSAQASSASAQRDAAAGRAGPASQRAEADRRDELLELLMGAVVGPRLGHNFVTFVHGYPASQAALARLDPRDPRAALRFEVYCKGVELANGFHELVSADEQRSRFERDNDERRRSGMPTFSLDERLLAALDAGLPDCAGVALGFDRTVMLAAGATHIDDVLAFPTDRA